MVALLDALMARLGGEVIRGLHQAGFGDARPGDGRVMSQLTDGKGRRLVDLAWTAGVTPQAMGQLLDRLEARGYIERRPDPTDRRAKLVFTSGKGQAGRRAIAQAVRRQEELVLELLGTEGYRKLRESLEALIDGLPPIEPG